MNALDQSRILNNNLEQSADMTGINKNFVFQHDNDPKHKAKLTEDQFNKNKIIVLDWPAQIQI